MRLSYTVTASDAGRKVYGILRRELSLSATTLKRLKAEKAIYLNAEPTFTTVRLSEGDVVSVDLTVGERDTAVEPEKGNLDLLYECDGFLAANKPCGMLVHPSRARADGTLLGIAAGYLQSKGESTLCHVVNRLDRDTGGVVLIAKTAHHKALLAAALSEDDAVKEYTALLSGVLEPAAGVIDAPIKRKTPEGMMRCVDPEGKRAVTEYETLGTAETDAGKVSLVRFRLKTGRTHQIRVHASHMGAPLLGDSLYGNETSQALSETLGITAQALHAGKLSFRDPITGEPLTITAPILRTDMTAVIDRCFG